MSLTLNSRIIADTRIQGVSLRPLVGAYELNFGLYINIHPDAEAPRFMDITGAQISIRSNGRSARKIGFARPQSPFEIRTNKTPFSMTPGLSLPLQPSQLAAIEDLRGTGDLDFEMLVIGNGEDQSGKQLFQETWSISVPRSQWLETLRKAGARDILLLEVPLPLSDATEIWAHIADSLRRAEEQYRNGDYLGCVASCRTVIQELGHHKFQEKDWAVPLLNRIGSDRNDMTKDEREAGLWGMLRHYTHQAHHGNSEGGTTSYLRSDAQLVLTLAASFVAHAQAH